MYSYKHDILFALSIKTLLLFFLLHVQEIKCEIRRSADHLAKTERFNVSKSGKSEVLMSYKLNFLMSQKLIVLMSHKVRSLMSQKLIILMPQRVRFLMSPKLIILMSQKMSPTMFAYCLIIYFSVYQCWFRVYFYK